jgi:hypothetical protein
MSRESFIRHIVFNHYVRTGISYAPLLRHAPHLYDGRPFVRISL